MFVLTYLSLIGIVKVFDETIASIFIDNQLQFLETKLGNNLCKGHYRDRTSLDFD